MSQARLRQYLPSPRKRVTGFLLLSAGIYTVFNFQIYSFPWEDLMEQRVAYMQSGIEFLGVMCKAREKDIMHLQRALLSNNSDLGDTVTNMSSEVQAILKNMTGTKTAEGLKNLQLIRTPFMYQLLPDFVTNPIRLRPAFHMTTRRHFVDMVIGIPTVKRDKTSYLLHTLSHLIEGVTEADLNNTLIIVFIGETDLKYVIQTAHEVENFFQKYVAMGLLEVLSPASSFYPDFDLLSPTLGDTNKQFRWRTKENLDAMFLMAYAQTKGTYYLMLEDDVMAEKGYMQDMKKFTAAMSVKNPSWFFIDYCHVGSIGKLFRSADLLHFIMYMQLFYRNMPMDWLLDSYLSDRICSLYEETAECEKLKDDIRPTYDKRLFAHVGIFSSLKGKIQTKVKNLHQAPTFYNHTNPPAKIQCDLIEIFVLHTIQRAYEGKSFFWGSCPKKGDIIAFIFEKPTVLESFKFRSGNVRHTNEKFYNTVVEIRPINNLTYINVGTFDEYGLAEGKVGQAYGPLELIRLRVVINQKNTRYWVVLSEIELKVFEAKPQNT